MAQITSWDLYDSSKQGTFPSVVYGFHQRLSTNFTTASIGPLRTYFIIQHPSGNRSELFLRKKNGTVGKNTSLYSSIRVYDNLAEAETKREEAKLDLVKALDQKIEAITLLKQGLLSS